MRSILPVLIHSLRRARLSVLVTAASLLGGCLAPVLNTPPTPTPDPSTEGWTQIAPGFEQRTFRPGADFPLTSFVVLRFDPALYSFRAHYQPGDPLTLQGWRDALPEAVAFVNANFFTQENTILGLLVADGIPYGRTFTDRGGMLSVQNGAVQVRSLLTQPYQGEALEQAVQAFPMLVTDGQASFSSTRGDAPSRRTVAAQDAQGRILLLATTSLFGIRLADLSTVLANSDLGIVNAVNLDGGGSTMLYSGLTQLISIDPVPAIIAAYPRP